MVSGGINGDRSLWVLLLLLGLFSFLPVFSAASNLAYTVGQGTPYSHFVKHMIILVMGFVLMYIFHNIPQHSFRKIALIGLILSIGLLVMATFQNTIIGGAKASRWLTVPILGLTFQPSNISMIALMIYCAHILTKKGKKDQKMTFYKSILLLWLPIGLVVGLVLPFDLSTAALILLSAVLLIFIGGYSIKRFLIIGALGIGAFALFIYINQQGPEADQTNRLGTWKSRVDGFLSGDDHQKNYQIVRAKAAIASGKIIGVGPGKSRIKTILPQSTSDFIYAIIVEEYGFLGGVLLMLVYCLILFRIVVITYHIREPFKKLLVIGIGIPFVIQALVNIAVSLQLLPVTGLALPMMSMGGTSIWITCMAFGIILGMSKYAQNQNSLDVERIRGIKTDF